MGLRSRLSPEQRLGLEAYLEGAEEVAAADAEKVHAKRKVQLCDCVRHAMDAFVPTTRALRPFLLLIPRGRNNTTYL